MSRFATDPQYLSLVLRNCPPSPEVDLWLTCIAQGIFLAVNSLRKREIWWIYDNADHVGSFIWICEHLDINSEHLRELIAQALEGKRILEPTVNLVKTIQEYQSPNAHGIKGKGRRLQRAPRSRNRIGTWQQ